MGTVPSYTRQDLLALTPERILRDGYLGDDGLIRPALLSEYATAACVRFLAAELAPQEMGLTIEAVRQTLALQVGAPADRVSHGVEEALGVIAHAIQQPNNEVLVQWLTQCALHVTSEVDLGAFLAHLQATERQYSRVAAFSPPPPPLPLSSAVPA